jgi:hypothetical protein
MATAEKFTMNKFIAEYTGPVPQILALKAAYVPRRGRVTEKSLTASYGDDAHATWAEFVAMGGK